MKTPRTVTSEMVKDEMERKSARVEKRIPDARRASCVWWSDSANACVVQTRVEMKENAYKCVLRVRIQMRRK